MNDETRQPDPPDDNENRFNELYEKHRRFLYCFLRIKMGSREVKDVLQEMWLRIHKWRKDHGEPEKIRPWLIAIALNEARRHFHKNGRPHESIDELDNLDETPATDPWADFIQDMDLERILQPLTDDQRELVVLHFIKEYGLKEIAEMKGVKEGTIRARLFRFKKDLSKILKRHFNLK